jgi:single-strand DNA-binding protein
MVNKVILIGYLGADPEVRFTTNETAVTNLRLATKDVWHKAGTKEKKERTDWHKCTCWGRIAEIAGEFLHTGDQIYIEGQLRYGNYTNSDNVNVRYSYVHVVRLKILNTKKTLPKKLHEEMEGDD